MSGSQIGGIVGGGIGLLFGAPKLGYFLGSLIGGYLKPEVIKGPSIGDAQAQTAQAGVPRPVIYGHPAPFKGNLIDGEKIARKTIKKKKQGKGGGPVTKEEHFKLTSAIGFCERPSGGNVRFLRVWRNGVVMYDARATEDMPGYPSAEVTRYAADIRAKSAKFLAYARFLYGAEDQLPDPALEAIHGVGNTPYFRGTVGMVIENDDVTDSRGACADWMVELVQDGEEIGDYSLDDGSPTTVPRKGIPGSPGWTIGPEGGAVHDGSTTSPAIQVNAITLRSVEEDIAASCGVPASKIDFSGLVTGSGEETDDIEIPGYLIAQQHTGAECLVPLMGAFFHDLPEVDGKIVAVMRGGDSVATITDDNLLDTGDDDPSTRPQAVEYPAKVTVVTQEPETDYSPVPQTSNRSSPDITAVGEVVVNLPIPFGADKARQIAEKMHQVLWTQAEKRDELSLPEEYSILVGSDAITFNSRRFLIIADDFADGEKKVKVVLDRASDYTSNATGTSGGTPTPPSVGLGGPTVLEFLNVGILADSDDKIGFHVAVSGYDDSWPGCTVQGSIDGGTTYTNLATITDASLIGSLITALPNASAAVLDTVNTVRVVVVGELDSITSDELLAEQNACVIGDELCQFQTATLISTSGTLNTYDLSILARGRLNSTPALHAIGARFVLLNAPVFCEVPSSWIGQTITLRAVTTGTLDADNDADVVTWTPALIQTEWAPVGFVGTRDGSNNIAISWIGRGRLGTTAVPLQSVNFTGYRVTIAKGAARVVKTLTSNQFYAYTAAEQTTDFGSATGTLTVTVEAMNRITGASAALTGSIP